MSDFDDALRRIGEVSRELRKMANRLNEVDAPEIFEDEEGDYLDPAHHFREGEQFDVRATRQGWRAFLDAHPELDGRTFGPGVTAFGDIYPLQWHYRGSDTPALDDLLDAVTRAYAANDNHPVTHQQVGVALWGHDADARSSGNFCGILYHAAKRGEVIRYGETRPARFAPVS